MLYNNVFICWILQFGIMVGTFIGPAGIYMAIAGGVNQVRV